MSRSTPPVGIDWTKPAEKDLRRLTLGAAGRVRQAVQRFADGGPADFERLRGFDRPRYRLRVGAWRVILCREDGAFQILRVFHRREAYRKSAWIRQATPEALDRIPDEASERSASSTVSERTEG